MSKAAIGVILFAIIYMALLFKADMECDEKGGTMVQNMYVFRCLDARVIK